MTDESRPQHDPEDATTVNQWPPFGQPAEPHSPADETPTQWVAADRSPVERRGGTAEPSGPGHADGWFLPAKPNEPTWAPWDEPWEHPDEPFDQAAASPESAPTAQGEPAPTAQSEPPPGPAGPIRTAHPADEPRRPDGPLAASRASWANLQALRILAQVACPLLLLVGLTFTDGNVRSGWEAYPAWAIFALVCAVLQLAPLLGRSLGLTTENAWFLAAVGTAGLVGYWVIIVLPGVSSNTGFAQTLAAGAAVIGLWLSPGRRV